MFYLHAKFYTTVIHYYYQTKSSISLAYQVLDLIFLKHDLEHVTNTLFRFITS